MTGEHDALRDTFRSFFTREAPPARVRAAEAGAPPGFDEALWTRVAALGVPDLAVEGATLAELAVVVEEYGRALAPIPMIEALVAVRLLDRLDDAGATAAAALVAPAPVTVALRPARDGVASLVPAGAVAGAVLALDGADLVLARIAESGATPANVGAGPVADTVLTDAVVVATGRPARDAYGHALDDWRLLTASALIGLARRALELGVEYAIARHQFGVPIGSFQALQHRLADVATGVDAAGLLVDAAAAASDPIAAASAYVAAIDAARVSAGASLHVHGGYGFMLEYDIQLYFRRASAWPLALGDPDAEVTRLADLLAERDFAPTEPDPSEVRAEVRAFLADVCDHSVVARVHETGTVHDWGLHRRLAERGYLAAGWPTAWGGDGRDDLDALIVWEELERLGAPVDGWGTTDLVARTLALVGSEAQQRDIIPRVLRGEILICLGYSEPDSGSDVAAATTRAARDGGEWVINGQKMFTTLAHEAAYVFLLTRTNPDVPKHRGLTMFLVPMDDPGIEVTPIHTVSGERTNITYYRDVRVADDARVGEVDGGWDVMRVALTFERNPTMVRELDRLLRLFVAWAGADSDLLHQPRVRARLARASIDLEAGRRLGERMAAITAAGGLPTVEGSMAKLFSSEALVRHSAALVDALGPRGILTPGAPAAPADGWVELMHRHAQVTTIRAGTSEIQRGIIAERGLGLPRAGR